MMKKWDKLPENMQLEEIRYYYDLLKKKQISLIFKRVFDIVTSAIMLVLFFPVFLILAVIIKLDSSGPVFYRQERVTRYGKHFRIHKFRTMVDGADKKGSLVTVGGDVRVTRVGKIIRKFRLDEVSQLIDILQGTMTFVGTRPEVVKYVEHYTPAMMATLLLPAGVTSEASILYKDEEKLLNNADNPDDVYINKVLPEKMYYNLKSLEKFSFWGDIRIMFMTVLAVLGKEYKGDYIANRLEEVEVVEQ